jgi:hypothetical protein
MLLGYRSGFSLLGSDLLLMGGGLALVALVIIAL